MKTHELCIGKACSFRDPFEWEGRGFEERLDQPNSLVLKPTVGGAAGRFLETSGKRPLRHPRSFRHTLNRVRLAKIRSNVIEDPCECLFFVARIGRRIDELFLAPIALRRNDESASDDVGDARAEVPADQVKSHVDSSRASGRSDDGAFVHIEHIRVYRYLRILGREGVGEFPMSCGPLSVEKSRGGEHERAGTDGDDTRPLLMRSSQLPNQCLRHGRVGSAPARNDDRPSAVQHAQGVGGLDSDVADSAERAGLEADDAEAIPAFELRTGESEEFDHDAKLENTEPIVSEKGHSKRVSFHGGILSHIVISATDYFVGNSTYFVYQPRGLTQKVRQACRGGTGWKESMPKSTTENGESRTLNPELEGPMKIQLKNFVTELPTPVSGEAVVHFESKLANETDCWDVHSTEGIEDRGFVLVDVRAPEFFAAGHLLGAVNIPYPQLTQERLSKHSPDRLFVVYCAGPHCNGSTRAALRLARLGRPVKEMIGGVTGWLDEGLSLVTE